MKDAESLREQAEEVEQEMRRSKVHATEERANVRVGACMEAHGLAPVQINTP
jgi:hypothetical protein